MAIGNGNKNTLFYSLLYSTEDEVYFNDTKLLEEYILNDSGAIFHGNYKQVGAKPWFYGQVVLYILNI